MIENLHIRWMIRRDVPEVLLAGADTPETAWTEARLVESLGRSNCIGMVGEWHGRVIACAVYELLPGELRVLNLAVRPLFRRLGAGAQVVARLASKLAPHRRRLLTAVVPETNLPAQLFFRACGFRAVRVMRGHYGDGCDGYAMCYTLRVTPPPSAAASRSSLAAG